MINLNIWALVAVSVIKSLDEGVTFATPPRRIWKRTVPSTGDSATVRAWTFGHAFAKVHFGPAWHTAVVHGIYVGPDASDSGKPFAQFVWYTPDGDRAPQKTVLANVKWCKRTTPPAVLRHARQALFVLLKEVGKQLRRGYACTPVHLTRAIDIPVSSLDEFRAIFAIAQGPAIYQHVGKMKRVDTYEGKIKTKKFTYVVNFKTFREWLVFVCGVAKTFCPTYSCNSALRVLMLPAAQLASSCTFAPGDTDWEVLVNNKKKALPLSHNVPLLHGAAELESEAGRAAAANARDVTVYVLDAIEISGHVGLFYLAFVAAGYAHATEPPRVYTLVEGVLLYGHVGFVPASMLTWAGPGRRAVCATYSEVRRVSDGSVLRGVKGVGKARLHFRPTLVVATSGNLSL